MAIKMTSLRKALWKAKCYWQQNSLVPPAFWVGFWFANGAFWAIVVIGLISDLARFTRGLLGIEV